MLPQDVSPVQCALPQPLPERDLVQQDVALRCVFVYQESISLKTNQNEINGSKETH
jgi:hypothetical protein